jgi:hypothetical protein
MCVKAPKAKVGRSNRFGRASGSRAANVPGPAFIGTSPGFPVVLLTNYELVISRG